MSEDIYILKSATYKYIRVSNMGKKTQKLYFLLVLKSYNTKTSSMLVQHFLQC